MTRSITEKIVTLFAEAEKAAYQKGWDDAVAKIVAAASGNTSLFYLAKPKPKASTSHSPYKVPIVDLVASIIRERPGLRGVDIVREVTLRDPSISFKVADRTGRTHLGRLRKRGQIEKRDGGRWHWIGEEKE